tara:strand:- start:429 stop:638 length:210 start_codon:yes stop_codon:yes gene_type:complete
MSDIRICNVCNTKDEYENMIMDIVEILECSEETIEQWEANNTNIDLCDWFCMSCCEKVGNEIEKVKNNE